MKSSSYTFFLANRVTNKTAGNLWLADILGRRRQWTWNCGLGIIKKNIPSHETRKKKIKKKLREIIIRSAILICLWKRNYKPLTICIGAKASSDLWFSSIQALVFKIILKEYFTGEYYLCRKLNFFRQTLCCRIFSLSVFCLCGFMFLVHTSP